MIAGGAQQADRPDMHRAGLSIPPRRMPKEAFYGQTSHSPADVARIVEASQSAEQGANGTTYADTSIYIYDFAFCLSSSLGNFANISITLSMGALI